MDGERDYYALTSGLAPATLYSVSDHANAAGIDPFDFEYWSGLSSLGNGFSLADHKFDVITNGSGGGGGPVVYAYTDSVGDPADLTTYTFTGRAIGTAVSTRRVVVGITTNSTRTINSVTIGGISASVDATFAEAGVVRIAFVSAIVPTGTTADIVVTMDAAALGCNITVWALEDAEFVASDSDSLVDPLTTTVTTVSGDAVLAIAFESGVSAATFAWTGATERHDQDAYSATTHLTAADASAVGVSTVFTANASSGTNQAALAAAYRVPA